MRQLVIDVHAHYIAPTVFERFHAHADRFPGVRLLETDGERRLQFPGTEPTRAVLPIVSDLAKRVAWMDRAGIDHQLLGLWTDAEAYELPPAEGLAWSRFLNDCAWEALRGETRFTPLAKLPLQDGRLAAQVLAECIERGFAGAMIGAQPFGIRGGGLDDPSLDPFWQAASDLKAGIFLHPMFVCNEPRIADYDLVNTIGRVADTSIAVSRLLFSGHLLRYPGVKLVGGHGGAALPYALGRLGRNYDASGGRYADPRKGFEALFFDSCVFDADILEYLVKKAAPEHVLLGSDAPFAIGDPDPLKCIDGAYLPAATRRSILGGTAARVFRVRPDCWRP